MRTIPRVTMTTRSPSPGRYRISPAGKSRCREVLDSRSRAAGVSKLRKSVFARAASMADMTARRDYGPGLALPQAVPDRVEPADARARRRGHHVPGAGKPALDLAGEQAAWPQAVAAFTAQESEQ